MSASKAKLVLRIFLIHIFTILLIDINAQCNPPDQLPTVECDDAPQTCLQNACYTTSDQVVNGWNGFCGSNTAIHNPQYFEIIPLDSCIEILIHVDDCENGSALQSALVTSCEWQPCPGASVPCADVLDCDPGTNPGGTMNISACDLTPGVPLWLLIDGSSGAICQYTIELASGIYAPQINDELNTGFASPASVCQGFDNLELSVGPFIANAHGYLWQLGWNNETVTSTLPIIQIEIEEDAAPGIWEVCALAFSGCDTSEIPYCFPVEIFEADDVVKTPDTLCAEAFPFMWFSMTITSPGTYIQTFESPDECLYDSIWTVEIFPEVGTGEINIVHCFNENFDPFNYQGIVFDEAGTYQLGPEMGANGCDSFTILNLTLIGVEAFVENNCFEGNPYLTPHVVEIIPVNLALSYEWYDCEFNQLISTDTNLTFTLEGCYCLVINSESCSDTICSDFVGNSCQSTCQIVEDKYCQDELILFTLNDTSFRQNTFHWLIDRPGEDDVYFSGNDSLWLSYDSIGCYNVSLTIVTDTSTFTCIDSFCIEPVTQASLCCDHIDCNPPCTLLEVTLTGTPPWTIVISNGTTHDTITNITSSPYYYSACELVDGPNYFSLVEVYGSGGECSGDIVGDTVITVIAAPLLPELSIIETDSLCASIDMVSYVWHSCGDSTVLSTSQCFIPPGSGCYCVEVTDTLGCQNIECIDFITATDDVSIGTDISIFPNPLTDQLHVKINESHPLPLEWSLYDRLGVECQNGKIEKRSATLRMGDHIIPGFYLLKFKDNSGGMNVFKIIIEK